MDEFIVYDVEPDEKKRIRKLYNAILSGKSEIAALDYYDAVIIERMFGGELAAMGQKCHRYEIAEKQLHKRMDRLQSISDAVTEQRILKEAELHRDVFGDDTVTGAFCQTKPDAPCCSWQVVDDRTMNLYLAVMKDELSFESLDLADQCVLRSMLETKNMLSACIAQIQSILDAAEAGKMNLNSLPFDELQKIADILDQIISR